jgi:hypothetical protein
VTNILLVAGADKRAANEAGELVMDIAGSSKMHLLLLNAS